MDTLVSILTIIAAVSTGLMAGIYFIFSNTIMGALRARPAEEGAAAMQSINAVIQNPLFLGLFLGSGLVCASLAVLAPLSDVSHGWALAAAGALFFVGSLVVTMAFNVPLNNRLDAADPGSAEGGRVWADYLTTWTTWNHARAASSTVAAIGLTVLAHL